MKEKFRLYLLERYKPASVNGYLSGLNHLSRDYGSEILQITDFEVIKKIRKQYDLGGTKRNIGDYGNGSARNAMIQYSNFIETSNSSELSDSSSELKNETVVEINNNRRFTYERDLHNTLESQVGELFPEYKLVGSEYSIEGVRLDLLLEKENELLVVELKAGIATFEVFGQISMYIGLIQERFPSSKVRGIIIANEIHKGLMAACSTNNFITCKKYTMKLCIENA